jgi:signal transduction histidine kinase/FixJ family two-component response regulator
MLALIGVAGASLVFQHQERAERQAAIAANRLARSTMAIIADAVDAETGMRGYVATADPDFLEPYADAVRRIGGDVTQMRAAAPTAREKARANSVAGTVDQLFTQLAELRQAVLARSGESTGVAAAAGPDSLAMLVQAGKATMDQLRDRAGALAAEWSRVGTGKSAEITRLQKIIELVEVAGLLLGVLAGLAGIALFTSGISRRVKVTADNADRLGHGDPPVPTERSADELGRLGDSLTHAHQLLANRLADLSAARDQALAANETKNTFLSRTSHELRTPLNAILGFAQLLEMSELNSDDRDSTVRILGAGRHLLALINELIDIARVESGELRLSVEPVGVGRLVEDVVALMMPLAAARGITIEHGEIDHSIAAYADHQRLRQVLVNLASNAVKYNHHGGMITVDCRRDGQRQIDLTVTDTGPGLSADEITRIFIPFDRLDADQHGIEGTGIGLPLALALTEAMHGTLDVTSTPGIGSTFSVHLPWAPDIESGARQSPADVAAEFRTGRDTPVLVPLAVLSIEDNSANRELLVRLFRGLPGRPTDAPGMSLYSATSGHAGIEMACRYRPDLILLDLHLPDLPGEEVYARLRAEPATRDIPIVILSADATPGTIRRLLARGAVAYLTKPIDLHELEGVLAAAGARTAKGGSRSTVASTAVRPG